MTDDELEKMGFESFKPAWFWEPSDSMIKTRSDTLVNFYKVVPVDRLKAGVEGARHFTNGLIECSVKDCERCQAIQKLKTFLGDK